MRILAVHLKNYRGLADRRIEFPRDGVTVIEGPNGVGKSSIAESLDLLLNVFDSTTAQRWKEVQPAGKDVGTEVEAEFEVGEYRLLYRKRFFKRRQTELTIKAPRAEHLRGREAHERVLEILRSNIDYDLWRALQVRQNVPIRLPKGLEKAPSLVKALDRSAGGGSAGEEELGLFEAVQQEYAKFFTEDRGQARKPLQNAYRHAEEAASEVKRCEEELVQLEEHVERVAELDTELVRHERDRERAQENAQRREQELLALDKDKSELSRLELGCRTASIEESASRQQQTKRTELIARLDSASRTKAAAERAVARAQPAAGDIEDRLRRDRSRKTDAETRIHAADEMVQLREKDANFRRGEIDLAQLTMRRDRIEAAQAEAEAARTLLKETVLDDGALKELRELYFALERAQAQLDAGGPRLRVKALGAGVQVDGVEITADYEATVAERASVHIDGIIEVEVTAGTSVETLVDARDRVQKELQDLLQSFAVKDLEGAEAKNQARKEAERVLNRTESVVGEYLGDLDFARLCGKVENMRRYVARYPGERPLEPEMATDFDNAVAAKREAKSTLELARVEEQEASAGFSATNEAWQEMRRKAFQTAEDVRHAAEEERQAAAELQAARFEQDDERVRLAVDAARERRDVAEHAYTKMKVQYDARQPERLRELAENARRAQASASARAANAREERTLLVGRLQARGEDGLYDRREEARTRLRHTELELRALERRANAARLLHDTMRRARDEAQRSYVGPLRTRIQELGSLVFGAGFGVELDEELAIVRCTIDGVTLPFGPGLSGGEQEQLAILARVACAMTVDPKEGAPLIFDDTLGHTDPERLESMGAVLSKAGERCQILVLTCTPDRFRHIGGAHVIRL